MIAAIAATMSPRSSCTPKPKAAYEAMSVQRTGTAIAKRGTAGRRQNTPNVKIVVGHGAPNVGIAGY